MPKPRQLSGVGSLGFPASELKFKDYILASSGNNNIVVKMLQRQQQWEQGHYKCQSGNLSSVIMCIYNCVGECGGNS